MQEGSAGGHCTVGVAYVERRGDRGVFRVAATLMKAQSLPYCFEIYQILHDTGAI